MSFRKILFITNNFPPTACGVGDYTYKLAKVLSQQGKEVSVLCTYKAEVIASLKDFEKEGLEVLPIVTSWNKNGLSTSLKDVRTVDYEWISLQYVPFSYGAKGLPIGLAQGLKSVFPNVKWQIMFHELWVGKVSTFSLRLKIQGFIQKLLIKNMINVLNPKVVHSHSEIYLFQLGNLGVSSKKLPLFSNIDFNEFLSEKKQNKGEVVFTIFGGIIFGAPVKDFITELNQLLGISKNEKIKFNFVGNNGPNARLWISELKRLNISYHVHGFLSENEISEILFHSNYGITTTPYLLTEKSGAVAAMKQHGLKIICVARDWDLQSFDKSQIKKSVIREYKKDNLSQIYSTDWEASDYKDVNTIGLQLIKEIDSH